MPAPQKLPSGSVLDLLVLLVLSITKLIDVSVRQLSKAKGPSCAPGGPWSQIIGGLCVVANAHSAERTALGENSSAELDTPRGYDLPKDIAALESSILKADDRKW